MVTVKSIVKYGLRCKKTDWYFIENDWNGAAFLKSVYLPFNTKDEAVKNQTKDLYLVQGYQITTIHPTHSGSVNHFITKTKKHTIRCPVCNTGTKRPKATYEIAYAEYLQTILNARCVQTVYNVIKN